MQAAYVEAYYLWKPWVPFNLSPIYTTLVKFNPISVPFLANAGLTLMTSAVLVWKRSRWPAALALWVCHLLWLVPVLGLTEHPHCTNDRYSLAGGIWWSVLASAGLFALWDKRGRRMVALAAVVVTVLALGALSVHQIGIWKHSVALFEYMIAKLGSDPYRADIYWRLGVAQLKLGQRDAALRSFNNALRIDPQNFLAHKLTADICYNNDRFEEARRHYEAALQVDPDDAELQNGLGAVFAAQGDWTKATEYFSRAVRLNPDLVVANYNMGLAMVREGRVGEAKFYLERAKKLKAKEPSAAK
jgi:Flp pilus assembly protein TadD